MVYGEKHYSSYIVNKKCDICKVSSMVATHGERGKRCLSTMASEAQSLVIRTRTNAGKDKLSVISTLLLKISC